MKALILSRLCYILLLKLKNENKNIVFISSFLDIELKENLNVHFNGLHNSELTVSLNKTRK